MYRERFKLLALLFLELCTVAFHLTVADVTVFGCQRTEGLSRSEENAAFGGTCSESTQSGVDFSRLGGVIVDGSTFLTESHSDCCRQCRATPEQDVDPGQAKVLDSEDIRDDENVSSGTLTPFVLEPSGCVGIPGFKADGVHYNQPELLQMTEAEECCLHCQAQAAICQQWSFDSVDMSCRLYSSRTLRERCETCTMGRLPDSELGLSDSLQQILSDSCSTTSVSGTEGTVLTGNPISRREAFAAETSTDCCQFCAFARECQSWSWDSESEECSLFGDIPVDASDGGRFDSSGVVVPKVCSAVDFTIRDGIDLASGQGGVDGNAIPRGFPEADPTQCALRCQENPACRTWTFYFSKSECQLAEQPSVEVRECDDCSSALYEARYATPRDKEILQNLEAEIALIAARRSDEPSPVSSSTPASSSGISTQSTSTPQEPTREATVTDEPQSTRMEDVEAKGSSVDPGMMFGVVAAALAVLLCIPLFFQYRKRQRERSIKAEREKIANSQNLTDSLNNAPVAGPSDATANNGDGVRGQCSPTAPGYEKAGLLNTSYKSSSQSHISVMPEEQRNLLKDVLRNSREKESVFQFRSGTSFKFSERILDAVLELEPDTVVANKYVIESGTRIGQNNAIVNAHVKFGLETPVVLKFFKSKAEFERESSFFSKTVSSNFLPDVMDIYDGDADESSKLPPLCCIVLERGDMSLDVWLNDQTGLLDPMDQRNILYKITRALQFLHDNRIVHRDLKPGNIVVFTANLFTLKLIDLGSACQRGQPANVEYTLRYAAPELISAHLKNSCEVIAHPSADMWPLGLIFWEILVGEPLLGSTYTEEEVLSMLAGMSPLPFERVPEMWNQISNRVARRIVQSLLQRDPEARWTVHKVLNNAYFSTGHDTVAQEAQMESIGNKLQQIAEGVSQIKQDLIKLEAISLENLKLNASQALITCISFYDIDPTEFSKETVAADYIIQKYQNRRLRCVEAPLEPNYNFFVKRTDEPTSLLKINHRHLVRISIMTAGEVKVDVPVSEILWIKIWPSELEQDGQECAFYLVKNEGHVIEGIAFWDTVRHRDLSLQLLGKAAVDVAVGFRLKGQQEITVVQKTVLLRMHPENAQFRTVKAFNRTRAFYSNLPQWAKIYIHGSIALAKFVLA